VGRQEVTRGTGRRTFSRQDLWHRLLAELIAFPFVAIVVTGMTTAWFLFAMLPSVHLDRAIGLLISVFVGTAVLDVVLGQWAPNIQRSRMRYLSRSLVARLVPIVAACVMAMLALAASITFSAHANISWLEFVVCAVVVGLFTGAAGIVAAHELIHRARWLDRLIGAVFFSFCCYPVFFREHLNGHHVGVATHEDPATARLGESVYRFLPRAILGTFRGAWRIERALSGSSSPCARVLGNATLWLSALTIAIIGLLFVVYSGSAALFFGLQGFVAVVFLETINYVQHYGLKRQESADGNLVPVSSRHAFNSPFWFSNVGFLNLPLHSDHHVYPRRPFVSLRVDSSSPLLPLPIFTMLILAYIPPIWFWLMNRRAMSANAL
jgi:alkane 1-monooxygenase